MLKWKSEQVKEAAAFFVKEIDRLSQGKRLRFMEVCGTHTVAIFKQGLRQLLPEQVELVSGPGCPVCVTPNEYMDQAVAYSLRPGTIITTFGDMLRVPGTYSSLAEESQSIMSIFFCVVLISSDFSSLRFKISCCFSTNCRDWYSICFFIKISG